MAVAPQGENGEAGGRWRRRLWCLAVACVLVAAADPFVPRVAESLPNVRGSALYNLRYMGLHPEALGDAGELRVYLIGASVVRDNLDEDVVRDGLAPRSARVSNVGVDGSYCLTMVPLAAYVKTLKPDLVVWGINEAALRGAVRDEYPRVWDRPITRELGSSALYGYMPDLPGRLRATCQDALRERWNLYAYRLYLRQCGMALPGAVRHGPEAVYGTYHSPSFAPDPQRLEAALRARAAQDTGLSPEDEALCNRLIEGTLYALDDTLGAAGCQLAVVWLPQARDAEEPLPPQWETVRVACSHYGIPFVDLRGRVPASGFVDTVHANRDGKRRTTALMMERLLALCPELARPSWSER